MAGSHVEEGKSQILVFDKGFVKRVARPRHICLGVPSGGMEEGNKKNDFSQVCNRGLFLAHKLC